MFRQRAVSHRDSEFIQAARAAEKTGSNPLAGFSLFLLVVIIAIAYRWADTAIIDEVTRSEGKIIPSSREQVIQSLEGGILVDLEVREGDIVDAGQVLLRIDDTRSGASLREGQNKVNVLRAEIARLAAEADGGSPRFDDSLDSELVQRQLALFQSRRRALNESVGAVSRNLRLAEEELAMTEPMVARGAVSEVDVLRLKRDIVDLKGRIQDRRNTFRAESRAELAQKQAELSGIEEIVTAREDEVKRSVIRSPMRGTVKNIRVTTRGGVIGPGEDIMEIVPLEDRLLVEAKVRPSDVAFLRPGQAATVKLTAYDYTIYGSLQGSLEQISADTISDENNPQDTYYRVYIRTETAELEGKDGPLPVIPGMVATAEVLTGQKSVLEYLLKPVLKVRDGALHER